MIQQNSKDYVLKHDFGYGREEELEELYKLELRNFEDVKVYVEDVIKNAFNATYQDNIIKFKTGDKPTKVIIKQM